MLVFTGGKELLPIGIIPLRIGVTKEQITQHILSHAVPLIINFNKKTQPLIHTLPIKVTCSMIFSSFFTLF